MILQIQCIVSQKDFKYKTRNASTLLALLFLNTS